MKKNADTAMTTATELLAERRKYEAWLSALHDRRESTPAHVFTRVLADYEARLAAVVNELSSKADAIDARVAELVKRSASLDDDARNVRDERAEAELRAHVGELEGSAWERAAQDADTRLASLGAERDGVEKELATLREMLGAARQQAPGRPQGDAIAAPAEAAAGGDAPLVTDPTESDSEASAPARGSGNFDELAFLRDVTGEERKAGLAALPTPPSQGTLPLDPGPDQPAEAPQARSDSAAQSEPQLDLEPDTQPAPERPIKDTLGLVLPDERPALPARRSSTEIPLAAHVTGSAPIILETGGKQNKTLKCTDCGSMNYPTEWYCERCGAELSAL